MTVRSRADLVSDLYELAIAIQRARTVDAVLDVAGKGLLALGLKLVTVKLEDNHLVVRHMAEKDGFYALLQQFLGKVEGFRLPQVKGGVMERVIRERRIEFLEDLVPGQTRWLRQHPTLDVASVVNAIREAGYVRGLLAPIIVREQPWGAIAVCAADLRAEDGPPLKLFAAHLGSAIEVADLQDETRRRFDQLSLLVTMGRLVTEVTELQPLIDELLRRVTDVLSLDISTIHLVSEGKLVMRGSCTRAGTPALDLSPFAEIPLDRTSMAGIAATTRATASAVLDSWPPAFAEVARQLDVRHGMAVPLVAEGKVIGALSTVRRASSPFAEDEVQLLESCAGHVAAAIEHARLFEAERRRVGELSLINELGALIAQRLDLPHVLDVGVRQLARIAEAPNVSLMLLEGSELRCAANTQDHPALPGPRIPLNAQSLAAAAVRERQPIVANDPENEPRSSPTLTRQFGNRVVMAAPLMVSGEPVGSVVIGDTREHRQFTPADVGVAVTVANQLAAAIANARLYEDLKRSYEKLERAQEELVKRERLAALGELSAVVAHEVRNPLAVLFNALVSLRRNLEPTGETELLLRIMGEEADRLNRLITDLLDFARPSEPNLSPGCIKSVIEGAVEAARATHGGADVGVEVELPPGLPAVRIDAEMVRQAMVNLVSNAIQASPRGSTVRIRVADEHGESGKIRLEVIDQGAGVAPEHVDRIFQPFFTTKAAGTGLGLAVVKRIVEAHRGEISVMSGAGQGTRFTVRLPR